MLDSNKYVVNADPIEGEGYKVHTDWCALAPYADNQIFLGHFPDCWSAIKAAKALDIDAQACVECCKECHV